MVTDGMHSERLTRSRTEGELSRFSPLNSIVESIKKETDTHKPPNKILQY